MVAATATIDPSAGVIGNVQIGEKVFVGPNAVIRADEPCPAGKVEAIVIESEVNIQDGVIFHALGGSPLCIGKGSFLAHGAVINGPCRVDQNCFIGLKTVVFKTDPGAGVVIQHQTLVERVTIPAGMHAPSMSGVMSEGDVRQLRPITPELTAFAEKVRQTNVFLAEVG